MAKKRIDYFEMIKQQVSYSVKASNLLEEILCKYDAESINAYRDQMHRIEHEADIVHHDILNKTKVKTSMNLDADPDPDRDNFRRIRNRYLK